MNLDRLHAAEADFFARYPGGFDDPQLAAIGKRHRVAQLSAQARAWFSRDAFSNTGQVLDDLVRLVGRSSMVSMFEKPKFRSFVAGLDRDARAQLADALKRMLHGRGGSPERGFEAFVDLLSDARLAKWSLVSAAPYYFHPDREVFVKPTTVKGVIAYFELDVPPYRPRPAWSFYEAYRARYLELHSHASKELAPNNAAFSGFLMMSLRTA